MKIERRKSLINFCKIIWNYIYNQKIILSIYVVDWILHKISSDFRVWKHEHQYVSWKLREGKVWLTSKDSLEKQQQNIHIIHLLHSMYLNIPTLPYKPFWFNPTILYLPPLKTLFGSIKQNYQKSPKYYTSHSLYSGTSLIQTPPFPDWLSG